jgi:hypothetical protein
MKPRRSPRRTAPRKRDALARCVNDLLSANAHGPGNLDVPALRRLLEFPKPDADIVLRHVFDAINAAVAGLEPDAPPHYVDCLNCNQPLEAPAPEVQIARLREFQLARAAYWHWSPPRREKTPQGFDREIEKPGHVPQPSVVPSRDGTLNSRPVRLREPIELRSAVEHGALR